MIRVERTNPPKVLVDKSIIWREALANAKSKPERERCQKRYRHAQIKATLKRLFVGKCAYCESKMTHMDYGHIEHFRPKAGPHGRPELTFDWTNLFLACGICNGAEFKSDRFPKAAEGGPLVNPCDDDPGQHFTFEYDSHAKLASVCGKTTRGDLTVNVLGLNRHDLRAYRSHQIRRIVALASLASVDAEAADLFKAAQQSSSEYAAFARAIAHSLQSP